MLFLLLELLLLQQFAVSSNFMIINLFHSLCLNITAKQKPFRVGVNFDTTEVCTGTNTSVCEYDVSATTLTGGIQGFKLIYWQNSC